MPTTTSATAFLSTANSNTDPDFTHFEYVNPDAPKGGTLRLGWVGTFDNLNPYILKGLEPPRLSSLIYDTLTEHAEDEIFSEYGRLVERIEVPPDNSWVLYTSAAGGALARWQADNSRGRDFHAGDL